MYYTHKSKGQSRAVGIAFVVAFHAALLWLVVSGLGQQAINMIKEPIVTEIIELDIPDEEPPPPPPIDEIDLTPPPDQVILPEFQFDTPAPNAITQVELATDPRPTPTPGPIVPKPQPKPAVKATCNLPRRIEKPPYPSRSERLNEEGITTLRVCVTAKGRASEAVVTDSSGFPELDEAAVKWALGMRNLRPATVDGKPIDGCCMVVPLAWEIEEGR